jgi:pimeloyl-ACP methyl ester carboxylesterase
MSGYPFSLSSGRPVGVSSWGDPTSRRIVVFCHPTPGAGPFDPDPVATGRSGLRFISIDRPGYGGSDPLPVDEIPSVERFADDIAEYLRSTIYSSKDPAGNEFPRVSALGWSFGGAVALSFAARHPDLVRRVDAISTLTPSKSKRGVRYSPVFELRKRGIDRLPAGLARTLSEGTVPDFESLGISHNDPVFEKLGLSNRLTHMLSASYEQGATGIASDRIAILRTSWTDQLKNIACDCVLSYGIEDPIAGSADAAWYHRNIPASRIEQIEFGTHAAIALAWATLTEEIAAGFGARENNANDVL